MDDATYRATHQDHAPNISLTPKVSTQMHRNWEQLNNRHKRTARRKAAARIALWILLATAALALIGVAGSHAIARAMADAALAPTIMMF